MTVPDGVVILVRQGCHLCDDALDVVNRVCSATGRTFRVLDVDHDPTLRARYTDHVPVTLVDGDVVSYWFLTEEALTAALR